MVENLIQRFDAEILQPFNVEIVTNFFAVKKNEKFFNTIFEKKTHFVKWLLFEFTKRSDGSFDRQAGQRYGERIKEAEEVLKSTDNNDLNSNLLNPDVILPIYKKFLSHEYHPPMDSPGSIQYHLFALYIWYSGLAKAHEISLEMIVMFDHALAILAQVSTIFCLAMDNRGQESFRIERIKKVMRDTRENFRKQKVLTAFETIKNQGDIKPYTLAGKIQRRLKSRGESVPSTNTIVKYLREAGRIK